MPAPVDHHCHRVVAAEFTDDALDGLLADSDRPAAPGRPIRCCRTTRSGQPWTSAPSWSCRSDSTPASVIPASHCTAPIRPC
ncbi:hypothetical protein [Streptomyces sp. CBMA123]|uniref:hypothetical protein n=1 Tax=Streptomyces sp. CBMA123 TaxID=1896313 RepID=UPI001661C853|nr:hypothetical protein [Streptomyces sp. CBMA123]